MEVPWLVFVLELVMILKIMTVIISIRLLSSFLCHSILLDTVQVESQFSALVQQVGVLVNQVFNVLLKGSHVLLGHAVLREPSLLPPKT